MGKDPSLRDNRGPTPFNGTAVRAPDLPSFGARAPSSFDLVQRGMPNAESFGKQWGGNVGPKLTAGEGESKPGKTGRDKGAWGGNVSRRVTAGKPKVGAKSP